MRTGIPPLRAQVKKVGRVACVKYVCSTVLCATTRSASWENDLEIDTHTYRDRDTGTQVILDSRMPTLLCSGAAYIGLWPHSSSRIFQLQVYQYPLPCHQGLMLKAVAGCSEQGKTSCAQEIQGLGSTVPKRILHIIFNLG